MFLDEISKQDMKLIQEFEEKIINKLDDSTFNIGLEIARRIINKLDVKLCVSDYEHKAVFFKFDDIAFHKKMRKGDEYE